MAIDSKTRMLALLFVIIMALLPGCNVLKKEGAGSDYPSIVDVHKGVEGLKLEFVANMPPVEIYEGGDFEIGVKVSNKGAFDISGGVIVLSGYDSTYYQLDSFQQRIDMEGKSIYLPEGSANVIVFKAKNRGIPPAIKEFSTTFIATACYVYQTQATQEICISPDLSLEKTMQSACEPKSEYKLTGQGAPVAVSLIKQKTIPSQTRVDLVFEISAENKGKGNVRIPDAFQKDCLGPPLKQEEIDSVRIKVFLGGEEIRCSNNFLKLGMDETKKQPNIVTCTKTVDKMAQAYTTPLTVFLEYGYSGTATKSMKVNKRPT